MTINYTPKNQAQIDVVNDMKKQNCDLEPDESGFVLTIWGDNPIKPISKTEHGNFYDVAQKFYRTMESLNKGITP